MNNICLMGRLTKNPELKTTSTGVEFCVFRIAVDRRYKSDTGEKVTDFIDCKAWRKTAVFVDRFFDKGKMIAVCGEMQVDEYTDKDGNQRKWVYVNVENVDFCGSKSDGGAEPAPAPAPSVQNMSELTDDEDGELPF